MPGEVEMLKRRWRELSEVWGDGFIYKDEDICETKGEATLVGDRSLCGTSSVKSSNGTCWVNTTVNQ